MTRADLIQLAICIVLALHGLFLWLTFRTARRTAAAEERYARLRLRPLLKAEWFPQEQNHGIYWRIRNVGPGPAMVERIELSVAGQRIGEHTTSGDPNAVVQWRIAFRNLLGDQYPGDAAVRMVSLNDLNRALAPGEPQAVVLIDLPREDVRSYVFGRVSGVEPLIHFRSVAGDTFSTANQYTDLRR